MAWQLDLGARMIEADRVRFTVWAPFADTVAVELVDQDRTAIPMQPASQGYFEVTVEGVGPRARYRYLLDGKKARPDPASRFQPEGVHGPSAVVDPDSFRWEDTAWRGIPLSDFIIYELHVGTFTREGTFDSIIPHLSYLKETVGITAIELMPVAQFPGGRNWGYDGVYPFAPQSTYGGPEGLKRLVNACHATGLAVIMDVVYNHLGPKGNYLGEFGPYFTDRYKTPWGAAINYDGPDSDAVRHYVVSNARYWVTEYHIDALRLDAIHGIFDFSATHILRELASSVQIEAARLNRQVFVIAESDLNDTQIIEQPATGGYGLDGQWSDDFHHALRVVLTGESRGYYEDFHGLHDLGTAVRQGFVYSGQYSEHRRRRHGSSSQQVSPGQLVVFSQNHDQIGNRAVGDRLSTQRPFEALKDARALVLLSPNIPLLFMGEEYGETAPFQYFIEHGDPDLIEAVRQGRRREFAHFGWKAEDIPDPQDPATFERSRLNRDRLDGRQAGLLRWTSALIHLRKTVSTLGAGDGNQLHHAVWVLEREQVLIVHRWSNRGEAALLLFGFNQSSATLTLCEPVGTWQLQLDSGTAEFGGSEQEALPHELVIDTQGTALTIPAYTAAVYGMAGYREPM
ncbi:MAG: malto-oligosyltrehalose trehalohydrolase [Nitrospiraceae bacterium]|nr:MAG: malto-oligosyltrehalose trehalohydrolase [Nitrospiraceae bacterium]